MSSLYGMDELKRWQPLFERRILNIKAQIEGPLHSEGRNIDRLRQAQLLTPLFVEAPQFQTDCKQPFYYGSFPPDTHHLVPRIVLPTLSLKFLGDLLSADWWLLKHGYELKGNRYVNMLKYKRAIDFAGGKYPAPLDALGIPHTPGQGPLYDDPNTRDEVETVFTQTLFFITAHEIAHVFYEHVGSTPENETEADSFALDMSLKNGMIPAGMAEFFGFVSYWIPNGGDFESAFEYRVWLGTNSSYPVTAYRTRMLAANISRLSERCPHGKGDTDSIAKTLDNLGSSIGSMADRIDQHTRNPDLFWDALLTSPSVLAPTKPN